MIYIAVGIWTYVLFYLKNVQQLNKDKFIGFSNNKLSNQNISILAVMILIVFASIRTETVGFDTKYYYDNICRMVDSQSIYGLEYEILFQIINFIPVYIFKSYEAFNAMLLLCYIIILTCVCYASKNMSKDISLTMFLFVCVDVYLRTFGQLRQGIAIAILMVSTIFILKRKPVQFFALIFLATCFHKTAIVFAPVYLFTLIKTKYLHYFIIMTLAIIFGVFNEKIIETLCDFLNFDYFEVYIKTNYGQEQFTIIGKLEILFTTFIFLFFLVYKIIYERKHKQNISLQYTMFLNLFFCSVAMYYVSYIVGKPELFGRLVYYFFWSIIFIVPEFINTIEDKKWKKIIKSVMMVIGITYLAFGIFLIDAYGITNYKTIYCQ